MSIRIAMMKLVTEQDATSVMAANGMVASARAASGRTASGMIASLRRDEYDGAL
jgi:hypothetical protein